MVQKIKDVLRVGPRTKIADRDMKVGDIVLVEADDGLERPARVTGAYTLGGVWHVQVANPGAACGAPPRQAPPDQGGLPESALRRPST